MHDSIASLLADFRSQLAAVTQARQLEDLKVAFLGKSGRLTALLKGLKDLAGAERASFGQLTNQAKQEMEAAIEQARASFEAAALAERVAREWLDLSLDGAPSRLGAMHPVARMQYEIEDIFASLGFSIQDGPHCELDFYNFEALNIPKDHPARDMQDTFYFENGAILRTHTSAVQVRAMERLKPPFKIIGPGKVFRVERTDPSHEAAFHQLEGMVVAEGITVAHLIHTMKTLLKEIFKREVKVRLRPGFFPFVEPGFELDISCQICDAKGCPVCKHSGWIELMPCGMVHPNVLKAGGINTDKFCGFAFGLGLDRLVMMRYKVEDIRHLHSGDLRFSGQFV